MNQVDALVHVRFFAAARDAAGCPAQEVPAGRSLADTVAALGAIHSEEAFAHVIGQSTFLVDGLRRSLSDPAPLPGGATLDVLPPFAGG